MAFTIRGVEYYYANVRDELGGAYRVLAMLADLGVNLLAFTAVPSGPDVAQFALFPDDAAARRDYLVADVAGERSSIAPASILASCKSLSTASRPSSAALRSGYRPNGIIAAAPM